MKYEKCYHKKCRKKVRYEFSSRKVFFKEFNHFGTCLAHLLKLAEDKSFVKIVWTDEIKVTKIQETHIVDRILGKQQK